MLCDGIAGFSKSLEDKPDGLPVRLLELNGFPVRLVLYCKFFLTEYHIMLKLGFHRELTLTTNAIVC